LVTSPIEYPANGAKFWRTRTSSPVRTGAVRGATAGAVDATTPGVTGAPTEGSTVTTACSGGPSAAGEIDSLCAGGGPPEVKRVAPTAAATRTRRSRIFVAPPPLG
jgi:hypothetical protein